MCQISFSWVAANLTADNGYTVDITDSLYQQIQHAAVRDELETELSVVTAQLEGGRQPYRCLTDFSCHF